MISKAELLSTLARYKTREDNLNQSLFVSKVDGKSLSTNDFTNSYKSKLDAIASGAQVNVIESIDIDGDRQTITGKNVTLELGAYATKEDLKSYAKSADLTTVFVYKGTVAHFADLPTSGNKVGYVYNITNAGGSDSKGVPIKAGDNVVYCETTDRLGGWDVLGGTTDLSDYINNAALTQALGNYVTSSGLQSELSTVKDSISTLDTKCANTYVAKTTGKGLSSNDFTDELKQRLESLYLNANEIVSDEEIAALF